MARFSNKSSRMKEYLSGVERKFGALGETKKTGIYLELETSNPYPGLYATALMPNKDNTMIKLEGKIKFKGDAIIENNIQSKEFGCFNSDAPFYAPNIKRGSKIIKIESPNQQFDDDVELDMPIPPKVVVTPITDNPTTVRASVANITKKGFKIYACRTDTTGDLVVHWIALC